MYIYRHVCILYIHIYKYTHTYIYIYIYTCLYALGVITISRYFARCCSNEKTRRHEEYRHFLHKGHI